MTTSSQTLAGASGTFLLGGDLPVHRLGYGTMQLTGPGVWGDPADPQSTDWYYDAGWLNWSQANLSVAVVDS